MFGFSKAKQTPLVTANSHIGDRKENQDSYIHINHQDYDCYVVADGLGGHKGGQYASQFFCEGLKLNFATCATNMDQDVDKAIEDLINNARDHMCQKLHELDPNLESQTTVVMAIHHAGSLHIVHVGDSRAYLVRGNQVDWQTRDHSLAQLMVDQGELDQDDAQHDSSQNILFRSIQCEKEYEYSYEQFTDIQSGNALILCSDGFWTHRSTDDLIDLAKSKKPEKVLNQNIEQAHKLAKGDSDNITAMLVQF